MITSMNDNASCLIVCCSMLSNTTAYFSKIEWEGCLVNSHSKTISNIPIVTNGYLSGYLAGERCWDEVHIQIINDEVRIVDQPNNEGSSQKEFRNSLDSKKAL